MNTNRWSRQNHSSPGSLSILPSSSIIKAHQDHDHNSCTHSTAIFTPTDILDTGTQNGGEVPARPAGVNEMQRCDWLSWHSPKNRRGTGSKESFKRKKCVALPIIPDWPPWGQRHNWSNVLEQSLIVDMLLLLEIFFFHFYFFLIQMTVLPCTGYAPSNFPNAE